MTEDWYSRGVALWLLLLTALVLFLSAIYAGFVGLARQGRVV
jgi:hypothetical protein